MWRLPALREHHGGRDLPAITFRRRTTAYTTGTSWDYRITMTIGPTGLHDVLAVLLHELSHSAVGGQHGHGPVWAGAYVAAARQHWGAEHFHGVPANSGYAVDTYVSAGISRALGGEP